LKYYFIDEITASDIEKIEAFLKRNTVSSCLDKVFWIDVPDNLLTKEQLGHKKQKPYVFSVELGKDCLKAELFLRSLGDFKGIYQKYCTLSQRDFILEYIEGMIAKLNIRT
jgi:hypothetical protein